jgi:hypothetical protein
MTVTAEQVAALVYQVLSCENPTDLGKCGERELQKFAPPSDWILSNARYYPYFRRYAREDYEPESDGRQMKLGSVGKFKGTPYLVRAALAPGAVYFIVDGEVQKLTVVPDPRG